MGVYVPQIAAGIGVLATNWNDPNACDLEQYGQARARALARAEAKASSETRTPQPPEVALVALVSVVRMAAFLLVMTMDHVLVDEVPATNHAPAICKRSSHEPNPKHAPTPPPSQERSPLREFVLRTGGEEQLILWHDKLARGK
eukprot:CAMPEP_0118859512 /NCGR_PEP_ID=MMETSP1163-20130328/5732_1 /TAXON_ID=124430 /ORGANISM="Phaeomonas parva, Strain CCMP2877" /LENGTH=143 /DNA_ID=CAMNT_0006793117 /DNA_START=10 /DNA_END=440 /DNA_ORIENTATION=+